MILRKGIPLKTDIKIENHANRHYQTVIIALMILFVMPTMAQEEDKKEKQWNFTVAPYLLMPNMNGDVGLGPVMVNVDANPGEIFDNLDFGMMLYFEASSDKWVANFDLLYMSLGGNGETPLLSRDADVEIKQLGLTFNGLYRVAEWASVGVGFRVNSIKQGIKMAAVPGPGPGDEDLIEAVDASITQTWVDPLIVARVMTRFNDSSWRLGLVADIGGFGIGSDLAWQINPFVGYQFSKLFEIDLAYRWLAMDYETGSGADYFLYDMVISGPELGLLFHF